MEKDEREQLQTNESSVINQEKRCHRALEEPDFVISFSKPRKLLAFVSKSIYVFTPINE